MNKTSTSLSHLISLQSHKISINVVGNRIIAAQQGRHASHIKGRGMDFSEVRRYQAGDDIRHMQWRVTAKTGKPHIKLYEEEKERPVFLLCNFNPSMYFATQNAFKSVILAQTASLLAWHFAKAGDRVGGFFYSGNQLIDCKPKSRKAGVLQVLKMLTQATNTKSNKQKPLSDVLKLVRQGIKPGSLIFFMGDFLDLDAESRSLIQRLRAHNDIIAIRISDIIEHSPPKANCYTIANLKGDKALLDTADKQTLNNYHAFIKTLETNIKQTFLPFELFNIQTRDNLLTISQTLSQIIPPLRAPS